MKLKTYDNVIYKGEKHKYIGQKKGDKTIILSDKNRNWIYGVCLSEIKPIIRMYAVVAE